MIERIDSIIVRVIKNLANETLQEVKMRKIVQIVSTVSSNKWHYVYALCDDGSVWENYRCDGDDGDGFEDWKILPNIPQGKIPCPEFNTTISREAQAGVDKE